MLRGKVPLSRWLSRRLEEASQSIALGATGASGMKTDVTRHPVAIRPIKGGTCEVVTAANKMVDMHVFQRMRMKAKIAHALKLSMNQVVGISGLLLVWLQHLLWSVEQAVLTISRNKDIISQEELVARQQADMAVVEDMVPTMVEDMAAVVENTAEVDGESSARSFGGTCGMMFASESNICI
mmetsp:Transcript_116818/g.202720  ORF Transcript_116818/g.202720 Transcript_116818/m.202720 type:complete len:182 (-) Transcript_116818:16-561(-)